MATCPPQCGTIHAIGAAAFGAIGAVALGACTAGSAGFCGVTAPGYVAVSAGVGIAAANLAEDMAASMSGLSGSLRKWLNILVTGGGLLFPSQVPVSTDKGDGVNAPPIEVARPQPRLGADTSRVTRKEPKSDPGGPPPEP